MTSNQTISQEAKSNIDEIELDVTTSSQYFKPRPGTTYVIQVDLDKRKIKPVENPKFTCFSVTPQVSILRLYTVTQIPEFV